MRTKIAERMLVDSSGYFRLSDVGRNLQMLERNKKTYVVGLERESCKDQAGPVEDFTELCSTSHGKAIHSVKEESNMT